MEHHFFILMCLISVLKIKIERERIVQTMIFACVVYLCELEVIVVPPPHLYLSLFYVLTEKESKRQVQTNNSKRNLYSIIKMRGALHDWNLKKMIGMKELRKVKHMPIYFG